MVYGWFAPYLLPSIIAYALSFIALIVGSITDLRTREVPDWINYGLITSGIGLNLLFSVIYSNPSFVINSIIGLIIFFGIAYIMFYAGQWGGGDSQMLMGLGAMLGIDVSSIPNQFLLGFLINALLIGAIYGLLWSVLLVFKNKKKFWSEFKKILSERDAVKSKKIILFGLILLSTIFLFFNSNLIRLMALTLALLIIITFYLWIFVKAVEKSCMYKSVEPSKLTEGDWIVRNVYVAGKYITGPKDLGIRKSQIAKLVKFYKRKQVEKILIKEGIPFVPSFLMAFIATFIYGNFIALFFRI